MTLFGFKTFAFILLAFGFSACTSDHHQPNFTQKSNLEVEGIVCLNPEKAVGLNIRSEPRVSIETLTGSALSIHDKSKLLAFDEDKTWAQIRTLSNLTGWVSAGYLELCKDQTFVDNNNDDVIQEHDDNDIDEDKLLERQLVEFDEVLFTSAEMQQIYDVFYKKPDSGACDFTAKNVNQCTLDVYHRFEKHFAENPQWGGFTFGNILSLVFMSELGQTVTFDPKQEEVAYEAYLRNLWQKICGIDDIEGCNAKEFFLFLSSKQAWFARGLIEEYDINFIERPLKETFMTSLKGYFEKTEWSSLEYRRKNNGVNPDVPMEWANWACQNGKNSSNGYDMIKDGIVASKEVPILHKICDANLSAVNSENQQPEQRYHYFFGVVTLKQDEMLPPPSAGGRGCNVPCPFGVQLVK